MGQPDLRPDADEQSRDSEQKKQWIEIKHKLIQLTALPLFLFKGMRRLCRSET
jgi:hypothetical protein